jgi:hypothetical protein
VDVSFISDEPYHLYLRSSDQLESEVRDTEGLPYRSFLSHHTREHRAHNVLTTYIRCLLAAAQPFLLTTPRVASGSIDTSLPIHNSLQHAIHWHHRHDRCGCVYRLRVLGNTNSALSQRRWSRHHRQGRHIPDDESQRDQGLRQQGQRRVPSPSRVQSRGRLSLQLLSVRHSPCILYTFSTLSAHAYDLMIQ